MRKLWIFVLWSQFLCCFELFSQEITLAQCLQMAKQNYPSLGKQTLLEQSRDHMVSTVNMVYLPRLSLSGQITYQSEVTHIELPKIAEQFGIKVPAPDKDQYQISATLYQLIWDGGNAESLKKDVIAHEKIAQQELGMEMKTIEQRIHQLYFGILLLNARLNTQKFWEEELYRSQQKLESYIANGMSNAIDRDKLRVEQLKAMQQRSQLEGAKRGMVEALNMMTGQHFTGVENFILPQEVDFSEVISSQRPELLLLDAQSDLIAAREKSNLASNMPVIGAFLQGGYGKPGLNFLSNELTPFWMGGVKLSWDLGNLYGYKNRSRSLKLQKQIINLQKETVKYNLCTQRNQERAALAELQSLLKTDSEIIRLKEQIKNAAEIKMDNGLANISDVLKETSEWKSAKELEALHRIQYVMTLYTLKNITE